MPETFDTTLGFEPHESDEVAFDYVKSPDFRVVWVDGVIGSPTPSGNIHISLYAERPAIPRRQVFKVDPTTSLLGAPLPERTIGRNSVVREMSFDLMLTPLVATSIAKWLTEQVELAKQIGAKKPAGENQ